MNINKNTIQNQYWLGMPDFEQTKKHPHSKIIIRVENADDLAELAKRLEQPLTHKTKSAWFPFKSHWGAEKKVWISEKNQ